MNLNNYESLTASELLSINGGTVDNEGTLIEKIFGFLEKIGDAAEEFGSNFHSWLCRLWS